jgi:predicted transcriptional regulator
MFSVKARVRHHSYSLGPLEWQVMGVLWHSQQCSVHDVVARLSEHRSYTTIMTTMSRLYQKGLLTRTLHDRKFLYTASVTRHELEKAYVGSLLSNLLSIQRNSRAPESIMRHILERLSTHDAELFRNTMATIGTKPLRRRTQARAARGK